MDGNIGNPSQMNLILRPLENQNDPVWSVIISLIILLIGVSYTIRWVLTYDDRNPGHSGHECDEHSGHAGLSHESTTDSDTDLSSGN